ncbi:MAG: thioredoxin family protein [Leucobacter sp.]|nr:thioredoxin family protein [Leucobacter sp.]
MDALAGAAWILGLLVAATLLGFWLRARSARVQTERGNERLDASDFDLDQFGPAGAVVQFSTEFCSRCPSTKRQLAALTSAHATLQFQHLDVTGRPELASKYRLLQTPTVFTIGADGILRSRLSGALTRTQLTTAVNELTGETP